jgi:anaerobic magnesium-protoporphyrin IX monomethyl ester cyclase
MKILFLNPPFTEYAGIEGHGGKALPLNIAYVAAYLRQQRPDIELRVLDCEALELNYEQIRTEIEKIKPDLVAITTPTPAFNQVLEVCRIIKDISSQITTILGGPHPTALPQETMSNENIDALVVGEGEITFSELVNAIDKKTPLTEVMGIYFKDSDGHVCKTAPREFIKDLDILPFPARDLFDTDLYFAPPTKRMSSKKGGNMITSRGCCFQCTYCMASYMWQRRVRFRSIKNVVDEIQECVEKYDMGEFNFHDELFTVNRNRTIEFCKEIKRRKISIAWVCMLRADFIDEEMLREMKEAGCKKVVFGFESGSQKILDEMNRKMDLSKIGDAVKTVKKSGLKTAGNFIIGYIGETEETIKQTISLSKKLNTDTMAFFVASPYPGTEFYRKAKERGYFRKDFTWKDFTLVSNNLPPLNLPGLPAEKILYWQKKAYRDYYLNPMYIWSKVTGIKSMVDLKNLYDGAKLFLRLEK